jgi:hypothetical protein
LLVPVIAEGSLEYAALVSDFCCDIVSGNRQTAFFIIGPTELLASEQYIPAGGAPNSCLKAAMPVAE